MISSKNKIEGVTLADLCEISDDRGSVLHMLRNNSPDFVRFGECYFSEVLPGKVKAWRRHSIQTQNLAVPVGHMRIVIFDSREKSVTNGCLQVVELGRPSTYFRLQIPPNLWYGFGCIGDVAALMVNCADYPHDPSESEQRAIGDLGIPYQWENLRI